MCAESHPGLNLEPLSRTAPHHVSHPVMRQTWRDLTFLHWPFDPHLVRPLVPKELALDLFDGAAWVGLVPFSITGLTLPNSPGLPWLSSFHETNVRTYVVDRNGLRGIWFFSLDAARLIAVIGARSLYALPYYWARMSLEKSGNAIDYRSKRHLGINGQSELAVRTGAIIQEQSELDIFLTARFRLYAQRGKRLLKADVEHPPWTLRTATVETVHQSLLAAAGLPTPTSPPLVHFGGQVDVLVAAPEAVR